MLCHPSSAFACCHIEDKPYRKNEIFKYFGIPSYDLLTSVFDFLYSVKNESYSIFMLLRKAVFPSGPKDLNNFFFSLVIQ